MLVHQRVPTPVHWCFLYPPTPSTKDIQDFCKEMGFDATQNLRVLPMEGTTAVVVFHMV